MKDPCQGDGVDMEQVAWCGHLPVMRGGVATFTLKAFQPFAISLRADPRRSAGGPSFHPGHDSFDPHQAAVLKCQLSLSIGNVLS